MVYIDIGEFGVWILVVAVSLALGVKSLKRSSKDGSTKQKYDERQKLVRIRGAAYGLYATWGSLFIALVEGEYLERYMGHRMILLICIFSGIFVEQVYTVWNDGYVAVNRYPFSVMVSTAGAFLSSMYLAVRNMFLDGMMDATVVLLLLALLFFMSFMIMLFKYISKKKQAEE